MGVWAGAAALSLVLQQLVLTVTAQGIGEYSSAFCITSHMGSVKNLFYVSNMLSFLIIFSVHKFLFCLVFQRMMQITDFVDLAGMNLAFS